MIDISLPPPKLLPQHTQQKRGREVYQDTDGNNVQDGYFFPDNSDIAIPNKGVRPIQTGRGYWGPAGYVRCNGLSSGTYNDKSYVFTFKYAHTNYSGFFMHGRGATGDRGTIRSRNVSGKMSFYHQDGTELDIVYTFVPGQIYTLVWVAPQSLLSDGKVYVNGIDATPAWDQTATGTIAASDYMIGSTTLVSTKSACTFIEHRFYLNILLTQNEAIEYHETGDIASKTPHVYYNYEEGTGTTTYNLIANSNHGSVLNLTTQTALHVAVDGARSAQNERGYWFSSDVEGVGAFTPIRYNSNTIDVLGKTPLDKYLGQVRYDEQIKGSSVGNFDGVLYGQIASNSAFEVQNYELNFDIIPTVNTGNNQCILGIQKSSGDTNGLRMLFSDTAINLQHFATDAIHGTSIPKTNGVLYKIRIKYFNGTRTIIVNGAEVYSLAHTDVKYTGTNPRITSFGTDPEGISVPSIRWIANMKLFNIEYYELDGTGNRINELINLNFSETNGLVVHNLAANRPASSNMSWVLGGSSDGTQWGTSDLQYPKNLLEGFNLSGSVKIPADPSNPTDDILGNPLLIKGRNSIIPAENTTNRNPANAPELVEAGIPNTDNRSYNNIVADRESFYDNYEDDRVLSNLVYSDFPEPMAGTRGRSLAPTYGYLDHSPNLQLNNYVIRLKVSAADTSRHVIFGFGYSYTGGIGRGIYFDLLNSTNILFYATRGTSSTVLLINTTGWLSNQINEIVFSQAGSQIDIQLNGVDVYTNPATYGANAWGVTTLGGRWQEGAINSLTLNQQFYYLEFAPYSLEDHNRALAGEPMAGAVFRSDFSEEAGLTVFNTALNRPVNTDLSWILNGGSDGNQWIANGNKDYHHNLQYGYSKTLTLNGSGTTYGEIDHTTELQPTNLRIEFKVTNLDQSASRTIINHFHWSQTSQYGGFLLQRASNGQVALYSATSSKGLIYTPVVVINDDDFDGWFELKGTAWALRLNGVDYSGTWASFGYNNSLQTNLKLWAITAGTTLFKGNYHYYRLYEIDGSSNKIAELINLDFGAATDILVPNAGKDAPTDSDLIWVTAPTINDAKIPGDPNNPGYTIEGATITNPDLVNKYNRITNYLRR